MSGNWRRRTSRDVQKDVLWKLVDIPDDFKGVVIGKGGHTLNKISTMTGAHLSRSSSGEVFVTGTKEAKERVILEVKRIVSNTRLSGRGRRQKTCCFVNDFKLPHNCDLRLVPFESKSSTPECTHDYQLRLAKDNEDRGETRTDSEVPRYLEDLKKTVFQCLLEIKEQIKPGQRNAMWCHFGTVLIEIADEGDEGSMWTLDDATDKLNVVEEDTGKPQWCTKFKEGVIFDEKLLLGNCLEKPVYIKQQDLNFLTPSGRTVRCKMREKGCEDEEVGIPFNVDKDILGVPSFTDKNTNERYKGWLFLPTVSRLKADIIFPGNDFDCCIRIRENNDTAMERSSADKEEDLILLEYLSHMTLKEGEEDELLATDEKLPSGFRIDSSKCITETCVPFHKEFSITVSKERSFHSDVQDGNNIQRKTYLRLHCNKLNELLGSGQWEPQDIVDNFAEFVEMVQNFMLLDQKE